MRSITTAMSSTLTAMRSIKGVDLGAEFAQAAADVKLAERAIDSLDDEIKNFGSNAKGAGKSAGEGFTVMKGLAVQAITAIISAGKEMIADFIAFGDTMTSISSRLKYLTGGAEAAAVANEQIYFAAQRARAGYDDMAQSVNTLYGIAGEEFGSIESVIAFSETMSKAFAATGTGAQQSSAAMQQLTQAITSGVLAGDELRSIRENAPILAQGIEKYAQSVYGSTLSLKEMGAAGMLTSQIVIAATHSMAGEVDAALAAMPMTASQTATSISNSFKFAFAEMAIGFSQWVSGVMQQGMTFLINNFDAIANAAVIAGTVLAAVAIAFGVAWIVANLPIVAIIAGIVLLGVILSDFGVSADQILGFVGGLFGVLFAIVQNGVAYLWNRIALFVEFFANVWSDPIGSVQRLFIGLFNNILGIVESVAGAIGALFGQDWSGKIAGFRSQLEAMAEATYGEGAIRITRMEQVNIADAAKAGSAMLGGAGSALLEGVDKLKGAISGEGAAAGFNANDFAVNAPGGGKALKTAEQNKLITDEDIKLLADVAARDYQFQYSPIAPNMQFGDMIINNDVDADSVIERFVSAVEEMSASRLGVT